MKIGRVTGYPAWVECEGEELDEALSKLDSESLSMTMRLQVGKEQVFILANLHSGYRCVSKTRPSCLAEWEFVFRPREKSFSALKTDILTALSELRAK